MLGQGQVSTSPSEQEIEHHDVLAPIQVIPTRTLRKTIIGAGWPDAIDVKHKNSDDVKYSFRVDRSPIGQGVIGLAWQNRQGLPSPACSAETSSCAAATSRWWAAWPPRPTAIT